VENRKQKAEDRRQKTEDRRQKTEDRRQKTEDRRQKTEDRRQKRRMARAFSGDRKRGVQHQRDREDAEGVRRDFKREAVAGAT